MCSSLDLFLSFYTDKKICKGSKQLFTHSLLDLVNGSFVFMYVEEKKNTPNKLSNINLCTVYFCCV